MKLYNVYKDGEFYYRGRREDITDLLKMADKYFYVIVSTHKKYLGEYTIERVITKKEEVDHKRKTDFERAMEYLVWHLRYMGITNIKENPDKYIEPLKKYGIDATYYEWKDEDGLDYVVEWKGFNNVNSY